MPYPIPFESLGITNKSQMVADRFTVVIRMPEDRTADDVERLVDQLRAGLADDGTLGGLLSRTGPNRVSDAFKLRNASGPAVGQDDSMVTLGLVGQLTNPPLSPHSLAGDSGGDAYRRTRRVG